MKIAYLLFTVQFMSADGPNADPITMMETKQECEEMGEHLVQSMLKEYRDRGEGVGSVWYFCQEMRGEPIFRPNK